MPANDKHITDFKQSRQSPTINMTPLVDMVFLLIVFFMLTTTFSEDEAIELNFSSSSVGNEADSAKYIVIEALGDGILKIGDTPLSFEQFRQKLRRELMINSNRTIVLKSAKKATVQDLVTAIDNIDLAGGTTITLSE